MRRIITSTLLAASLVTGSIIIVGCAEDTVEVAEYEDCDVEDQHKKEDDCGYWQKGGEVHVGSQPDLTWLWIWYAWVIIGQNSTAPSGWQPPPKVKPPVRVIRVPKGKACAMSITEVLVGPAPAPPRPAAPAPPRINQPAPKAPANNGGGAKNNNAPRNQAPPKPGIRPAGC